MLHIVADGAVTLEHRRHGKREVWQGRVLPEARATFFGALRQYRFPQQQSWPPPPPGETLRILAIGGAQSGSVMVPWHEAMKQPGYSDAFRLLDEIIGQLSGGAVRVVKDSATMHATDVRRVE